MTTSSLGCHVDSETVEKLLNVGLLCDHTLMNYCIVRTSFAVIHPLIGTLVATSKSVSDGWLNIA